MTNKHIERLEQKKKRLQNSIETKIEYSKKLHSEIVDESYPREKVLKHNRLLIAICDDLESLNELMPKHE